MVRVADIAEQEKVSVQSAYRAVKRLGKRLDGHATIDRGVKMFDDIGAEMIRASIRSANAKVVQTPAAVAPAATVPAPALEEMRAAMLEMAGQMGQMIAENRRLSAQVESLRQEQAALRLRLEAPPAVTVEPVRPEPPRPDPREIVEKKVMEKPVQRDTASIWEGIAMGINDLFGFCFGRG